jgi:hypothetical protein
MFVIGGWGSRSARHCRRSYELGESDVPVWIRYRSFSVIRVGERTGGWTSSIF